MIARPVIKWCGGKGKLLSQLVPLLPRGIERLPYYEPFLGGGAMLLRLAGIDFVRQAYVNDACGDLINTYRQLIRNPDAVIAVLRDLDGLFQADREGTFAGVRESFNEAQDSADGCTGADRAAAMIFLSKTCFNGVWRVNKSGAFNCPLGRPSNRQKTTVVLDETTLREASHVLGQVVIRMTSGDWEAAWPVEPAFVFVDSPYDGTYASYTAQGFGESDQRRLAQACRDLDKIGGQFMATNADTPLIRELYQGFQVRPIIQGVSVNGDVAGRGKISDLVITNY